MKELLIASTLALACGLDAMAQANVYTYTITDEDGYTAPVYGSMRRVSPNGIWAAGGDESEETGAFLVNTGDPENLIHTPDGIILDVDDNGLCVGAWYEKVGYAKYKRAAIYKDGAWTKLPAPEEIIGQSYAVAISADSRLIAGHAMCSSGDAEETGMTGGKYFPVLWQLDESTGEYALKELYNKLDLPGTYGFFVYDMTPDGSVICGLQCLDMGDNIAVMLDTATGTLTRWHNIEYKEVAFEFNGKWYSNDCMFVDGILDGGYDGIAFSGAFLYATDRYLFGSHDVVTDVQPDGSGVVTTYATAYDLQTGTFIDGSADCRYMCGANPGDNFTTSGLIDFTQNGAPCSANVNTYLSDNFGIADNKIAGVYGIDDSSKVWGAVGVYVSPIGETVETPMLVMLDKPAFSGIGDIRADKGMDVRISVNDGVINVDGADRVTICNVSGRIVNNGNTSRVNKGIYIINADGYSYKVNVK